MPLKRILDLCEKQGFVKRVLNEVTAHDLLKIGPTGALLQENLKKEWFYSMIVNRDNSVFLSKDSFVDTFDYAKEMCQERLPFGIAEVLDGNSESEDSENTVKQKENSSMFDFDKHFKGNTKLLRTTMFVTPSNAIPFFHQWQRQRRMWWRKFSASPGKYVLTDIQNIGNGSQSVEIKADYPSGMQLIESLKLSNVADDRLSSKQLEGKDGRKKVQAHSIRSDISLSSMVLNALCDAYDESIFQGESRPLLRLHRKLAPYKISFAVSGTQSAITEELGQLALYLCKQLRTDHVSSLLLPSAVRNSLEVQWRQYDQLGVPYTVLLNENTLKNGIALLRSRDTTLKEQVHVTRIPSYVQQLFKNY